MRASLVLPLGLPLLMVALGGLPLPVHADNELAVMERLKQQYPTWQPNAVVDIGANHGGWTVRARTLYPDAKYLMLEAFESFRDALQQKTSRPELQGTTEFKIAVLSERDGDMVQFWGRGDTGNSMYRQQYGDYLTGQVQPVERITETLDTIVTESPLLQTERIDYVKLDVQGAELVVLRGATAVLQQATFVQLEASLVEYNQGGGCLHEIDDLLRQQGYFLYDFGDQTVSPRLFKTRGTGQFDALWIRPASPHLPPELLASRPNFCGSDRPHFVGSLPNHGDSAKSNTTTSESSSRWNPQTIGLVPQFVLPLILGILIGVFVRQSSPVRRDKLMLPKRPTRNNNNVRANRLDP